MFIVVATDIYTMYERILVPTDGSENAEAAMTHALSLATQHDAEIHLLHVINTRRYDTSIESQVAPLRRKGNRYIEEHVEAAAETDISLTTAMELGKPAATILKYADEHDVDLIVMGTRGHGGLARRLLGTTTSYVTTHANVPVYVVPAASEPDSETEGR